MDILLTMENYDVMDPKLRKIVSFFYLSVILNACFGFPTETFQRGGSF